MVVRPCRKRRTVLTERGGPHETTPGIDQRGVSEGVGGFGPVENNDIQIWDSHCRAERLRESLCSYTFEFLSVCDSDISTLAHGHKTVNLPSWEPIQLNVLVKGDDCSVAEPPRLSLGRIGRKEGS